MDTSKEYILMCSRATEVQVIRQTLISTPVLKIGDSFCHEDKMFIYPGTGALPKEVIWVPHQDQLQELCNTTSQLKLSAVSVLAMMAHWVMQSGTKFNSEVSMEQLWLLYLMQDRWNKKWDYREMEWVKC